MRAARIAVLPGDGIGPEVSEQACRVLTAVAKRGGHSFEMTSHLIGGAGIDEVGDPLPASTLDACLASDAVLLGAVGGPKWDDPRATVRPEQGLMRLRKGLQVYANLRPVKPHPMLADAAPIKREFLEGVDLLVVRELTGGIYFGEPRLYEDTPEGGRALDTMVYTAPEVRRIVRLACRLAQGRRKKVASVDKANVLAVSRLWREVATQVGKEFPDITMEHHLVDSAAMRLIAQAKMFDVIVTGNLFGDILTDEAAILAGSLGVLPSASLGDGKRGLYEPIHGSAPDIAGKGIANPLGTIMSIAMMLRHSLGLEAEAAAVEAAVSKALDDGCRTGDLGGDLGSAAMGTAVIERL